MDPVKKALELILLNDKDKQNFHYKFYDKIILGNINYYLFIALSVSSDLVETIAGIYLFDEKKQKLLPFSPGGNVLLPH